MKVFKNVEEKLSKGIVYTVNYERIYEEDTMPKEFLQCMDKPVEEIFKKFFDHRNESSDVTQKDYLSVIRDMKQINIPLCYLLSDELLPA